MAIPAAHLDNFDDVIYTQVAVPKNDPAPFRIFWLVPEEAYIVQIYIEGDGTPEFEETVASNDLPASSQYNLGSF